MSGSGIGALLDTLAAASTTSIEAAHALPTEAYVSNELYQLELERIFRREWICVGREEEVAGPGDYLATEVASEPLLIIRGPDGVLRALSNVCRHRYMQLVEARGRVEKLVCPYHGWTYQLDGALAGAPHMTENRLFERRSCRLPAFRLETWQGFVLVNLDPDAAPLAPRLSELSADIAAYHLDQMVSTATCDEIWDGNWKLAAENGSESYHNNELHRESVEPWMPTGGTYFGTSLPAWNCFHTPIELEKILEDMPTFGRMVQRFRGDIREPDCRENVVYTIYPSLVFDQLPGYTVWLSFLPVDVGRTRVIGGTCVPREALDEGDAALRQEHQATLDQFNIEDSQATWKLQRQFGSRAAEPGALSAVEEPLLHFYRYLARRLDPEV